MTDDEFVIGSSLNAKNKISLTASDDKDKTVGNIILEGSHINSQKGDVTLTAGQDIAIKNVTEYHETLKESKQIDSGFFSTKVTEKRDHSIINQVSGSTISGEKVTITAGNDLTIKGSNVVGTKDVSLEATNNVNITSAKETGKDEHYSYTKTSGLFSGGGLGFTIGSKSEKITATDQTLGEIGSTIGSTTGNVSIKAGNQVTSAGTTIVADKDLTITGKDVTIDNTINTYDSKTKYELKQSGLTVSIGGGIIDTALSASKDIRRSGEVQDQRLKALYEYKAVQDLTKLNNTLQGGLTKDNLGNKVAVSIGIGSSKMTSEQTSHVETVNTSNINAGGNVTITATAGDINLTGTKMNSKDITLDAKKDINIQGAENKQQTTSNTSSSSFSLGVSVGLNPKTVGYFGNISSGKGTENGTATANTGSVIDASGTLTIKSGQDTTIDGSKVKGNKVTADIKGDLNIASKQDTDNYTAKNQNTDLGFTAGAKIPGSRTGSFNTGKTNSHYASVTDQAGIFAGKDGFDITVGKNTDLKGAVIASTATPDKNKISTGTLTYSDIQNNADYSASSTGISYSSKDGFAPTPGMPVNGDASSTTKSAISPGAITITGNQTQDLSKLSRDPSGSLNALGKIFDKKSVQEKQELAQVFSEEANKLVGDIADREKDRIANKIVNAKDDMEREQLKKEYALWVEGGTNKDLFHALVGGLTAQLGGGDFLSGAKGAGFNEILQRELKNIKDPALHQWASLLVGTVADKILNGDGTGAFTALNGTKYNFLSHWQTGQRDDAIANEDWENVAYWDRIDKAQNQVCNAMGINPNSINWEDPNNSGLLQTISIQAQNLAADPAFQRSFVENLPTVDFSVAKYAAATVIMAGVIVVLIDGNWVKYASAASAITLKAADTTASGLRLTEHAAERANLRGFSLERVDMIVRNYSQKVYQPGGVSVYAKKIGNYYDVVLVNANNEVISLVGGNTGSLKNWSDVTTMLNNNGGYSSLPW